VDAEPSLRASVGWAERRDDVFAVLLVGSRARGDTPADVRSGMDLTLVATMDAFEWCERETAERLGIGAPHDRDPVRRLVRAALAQD
jgi:hypothetical protein